MTKVKQLTVLLLLIFCANSITAQLAIKPEIELQKYLMMLAEAKKGYIHTTEGEATFYVRINNSVQPEDAAQSISEMHFSVLSINEKFSRLTIKGDVERLDDILTWHFVTWVEEVLPLELTGTSTVAAHNNYANLSFGYAGQGVKVGVWEGSGISSHIDLAERYTNKTTIGAGSALQHSMAVVGILAGRGNMDLEHIGMAPRAELIVRDYLGDIALEMDTAVNDDSILVTQNSYSISPTADPCAVRGSYKLLSADIDLLAWEYPSLVHVYSAGNGQTDCSANGTTGFRTIPSGYQSAKNVITVGAIDVDENITDESAWGPVRDGRIKPEVVAMGEGVTSTGVSNNYSSGLKGTSYAAPVVSGLAAQLISKYRADNGTNPPSSLIRAAICNSATDLGNPGPDFKYGFGKINALNSMESVRTKKFYIDSVSDQGQNTHDIVVPSGTYELRVTIAWTDSAGNPANPGALVNDIDMGLLDPNLVGYLPWVLDTTGNNKNNNAVRGNDHRNNIEQITIKNPAAGTHTILVVGESIATNSQTYSIVYEVVKENLLYLTYPLNSVTWLPGDTQKIWWEHTYNTGSFTLEYSDGGAWRTIATGLGVNDKCFSWAVPDSLSGKYNIRIREGGGTTSTSNINIMQSPKGLTLFMCDSSTVLRWEKLDGASVYDVFMLQGGQMNYITSTSQQKMVITGLDNNKEYWFSLRARTSSGSVSKLTRAIKVIPSDSMRISQVSILDSSQVFCQSSSYPIKLNVNYVDQYWIQVQFNNNGIWYDNVENKDSTNISLGAHNMVRVKYINACGDTVITDTVTYEVENIIAYFTHERVQGQGYIYKFTPSYQDTNATYEWSFGDGGASIDMIPTYQYPFNPDGAGFKVTLIITSENGCKDTAEYQFPIGINDIDFGKIKVYPNPANGYVDIEIEKGWSDNIEVSLYNILGKQVNNIEIVKLNNEICRINTATLPEGVYVVKLLINSKIYTTKLVIER